MNIADIFGVIAFFAWALFIGSIIYTAVRASRRENTRGMTPVMIVLLAVALVFSVVGAGVVFIQPEERGVVISAIDSQGYRTDVLQPGLRWIVPFFEQTIIYPISRQTYTMSSNNGEGQVSGDDSIRARTKDGQEVFLDASVIYSIDPGKIIQLHINWQYRYEDNVIRPAARNTIRDAVSQYGVEEIVSTKRAEMEQSISDALAQKLSDNDLVLVDFLLRDIHFTEEYSAAVEQKQIAEQLSQQAKFVVEQRKQEAEQARQVAQGSADAKVIAAKGDAEARLIQAEAEAKALTLIAQAINENPNLLTYQYITKLSPNVQVIMMPSNTPFIFNNPGVTQLPSPE